MTPEHWLRTPGLERTLLAQVSYLNSGKKTTYLSTHPFVSTAQDNPAHTPFDDLLVDSPIFSRSMNGLHGSSTPSRSQLSLIHNDFSKSLVSGNVFNGQIDFYLGDKEWDFSQFIHISAHVSESITAQKNELTLDTRDVSRQLDEPIPNLIYASGNASGQDMPVCFGTCFNIEPTLESDTTHTYRVNFSQIEDVTQVRDNGIAVAFTKNNSQGVFSLNQPPVGRITADVKGYKSSTFKQTPAAIITALFTEFDNNNIAPNVADLPTYHLGIYRKAGTTMRELLDVICESLNAYHYYTRDRQFFAATLPHITDVASEVLTLDDLDEDGLSIRKTIEPASKVIVNYAKNHTVQQDGLAGGVSAINRATYSKEYQSVETVNILPNYPAAKPIYLDTCLVNAADANALSNTVAAMYGKKRTVYQVLALATPFLFELGQEIELTHYDYGFENGKNGIVIGLEDNPINGEVTVELWQ